MNHHHTQSTALLKEEIFAIEEYKSLRAEIDGIQRQGYAMDLALITGISAYFAFYFSAAIKNNLNFLEFVPLAFTTLAILRKLYFNNRMKNISNYIISIENHFYNNQNNRARKGWEIWNSGNTFKSSRNNILTYIIYITLLILAALHAFTDYI